jgi:hypothetical protein
VPHAIAAKIGSLPPVGSLFAAFLGYNPIKELLGPTGVLSHLPASHAALLTGQRFFPGLISGPFHHGLVIVFSMAIVVLVIAAGASALRGGRYVHEEAAQAAAIAASAATSGAGTDIVSDQIAADEVSADEVSTNGSGANGSGRGRRAAAAAEGRTTPDA